MSAETPNSGSDFFLTYEPDPLGAALGSEFCRFTHESGIDGLAYAEGMRLQILALSASEPGTGQFRRFIEAAKRRFLVVSVWEVWNPVVQEALERYGFTPAKREEDDGVLTGLQWRRYRIERQYVRGPGADLWRVVSPEHAGPWVEGCRAKGAWKAYKEMRRAFPNQSLGSGVGEEIPGEAGKPVMERRSRCFGDIHRVATGVLSSPCGVTVSAPGANPGTQTPPLDSAK